MVPVHFESDALALKGTVEFGSAAVGATAPALRVQFPGVTVSETVPRFESVDPSQAEYVNESFPVNPGTG